MCSRHKEEEEEEEEEEEDKEDKEEKKPLGIGSPPPSTTSNQHITARTSRVVNATDPRPLT
ncbi:hypothetical protein PZA11_000887 [Diplocarpon coronariae]